MQQRQWIVKGHACNITHHAPVLNGEYRTECKAGPELSKRYLYGLENPSVCTVKGCWYFGL